MAAFNPLPRPKENPAYEDVLYIRDKIADILRKMDRKEKFVPTQKDLDKQAKQILVVINKYHTTIKPLETHLKAAIIDLTEIPSMHPTMQRIAVATALKDACKNLEDFLGRVS